jgi:hypothetical protein
MLLLAAAPAAAQEAEATLFAGVATHWSRESLAVDDFEDTPAAVPARTASAIDAGSTFSWSTTRLTFELGAQGGELLTWRGAVHAGLATMRLSQAIEGGPRTTVSTAADDGLAGGVTFGLQYPGSGGDRAWWIDAGYDMELGYSALDNALLFGGTPIEGTAQWLRHDFALRLGWWAVQPERFTLYAGARAVWTTLSTDWKLAFDVPGVARDTDARFTTRWPLRWLVGAEWRALRDDGTGVTATLELSAGRLPNDVAVALRAGWAF